MYARGIDLRDLFTCRSFLRGLVCMVSSKEAHGTSFLSFPELFHAAYALPPSRNVLPLSSFEIVVVPRPHLPHFQKQCKKQTTAQPESILERLRTQHGRFRMTVIVFCGWMGLLASLPTERVHDRTSI